MGSEEDAMFYHFKNKCHQDSLLSENMVSLFSLGDMFVKVYLKYFLSPLAIPLTYPDGLL